MENRPGNGWRNGSWNGPENVSRNGARNGARNDPRTDPLPRAMAPAYGRRSRTGLRGALVEREASSLRNVRDGP